MNKRNAKTLSLFDLMQMYPTEESAVRYFESLRWGDKPVCVKRGYNGIYHNWSKKHCTRYVNEFTFRLRADRASRTETTIGN